MLQYSSEILKHLCDFPLPNVDLGFAVISVLQNTRGSTLGKERGAFELRTKVWRVNVWNSEKIQDKCLLFQRFVTSIVVNMHFQKRS